MSREIAGILTQAAIDDKRTPPRLLLHQSVRIENYDSIAEMFWRQLVTLDRIKKSIVDYKESEDLSYLDRTVLGLGNDRCVALQIYIVFLLFYAPPLGQVVT